MAVWSYVPQEAMAEALTTYAPVSTAGLQAEYPTVGPRAFIRSFHLRYVTVTSDDAQGMAEFFLDRRGAFEPFDWVSPNDGATYHVRFGSAMRLEHFAPGFLRTGEVVFTVAHGYGEGTYGGGGYGG